MSESGTDQQSRRKPLRLWPGVWIVALQWLGWYALPSLAPEAALYGMLGGLAAGPLLGLWWLFFSRAAWVERVGAAVLVVGAMAVTPRLLHDSVAQGNMGFQFYLVSIPFVSLAFVLWAVATRHLPDRLRRATLVAAVAMACGAFTLLRSEGITGDGFPILTWRWSPTAEERLLARQGSALPPSPAAAASLPAPAGEGSAAEGSPSVPADAAPDEAAPAVPPAESTAAPVDPVPEQSVAVPWPGFRGPSRDGVIPGLRIATDWSASPPSELWRRPVGPGVSSFAVSGDRLFTQEQRGEEELVAAYDLKTGQPLWSHADRKRFWDSHVGAGPRATPAVADGRVFALGATGILNALDAADGRVIWSRDAAADSSSKTPLWGFVSSPLVAGPVVIAHAGALVAYDVESGEPCWFGPEAGSYSSPQLLTIAGVAQVVLQTNAGLTSVSPADGSVLWEHAWPGVGIMQPVLTPEGDLLVSTIDGGAVPIGTRRLAVARGPAGWSVEERWTSLSLKPSFSPAVLHRGHAYGFDGRFVTCIDASTGERLWKGGRYGSGQLLLLPEQDLLLVLSEQGDLALVRATPEGFEEVARNPGIEGRTWNQPALVGELLLVRNGEEMAAFRLAPSGG